MIMGSMKVEWSWPKAAISKTNKPNKMHIVRKKFLEAIMIYSLTAVLVWVWIRFVFIVLSVDIQNIGHFAGIMAVVIGLLLALYRGILDKVDFFATQSEYNDYLGGSHWSEAMTLKRKHKKTLKIFGTVFLIGGTVFVLIEKIL